VVDSGLSFLSPRDDSLEAAGPAALGMGSIDNPAGPLYKKTEPWVTENVSEANRPGFPRVAVLSNRRNPEQVGKLLQR